jgi:antitoxin component of MazEF toxin-antitoxin module
MATIVRVQLQPSGDDALVVLPPEMLDRLGASQGGQVIATEEDGGLTLRPCVPDAQEPAAED